MSFADQVVMISVAFLVILFSVQKYGTSKVGLFVGPALFIWFCSLGGIGIYNLINYDSRVWRAFNPVHIYYYFKRNPTKAWYSLGGCLLCATGKLLTMDVFDSWHWAFNWNHTQKCTVICFLFSFVCSWLLECTVNLTFMFGLLYLCACTVTTSDAFSTSLH